MMTLKQVAPKEPEQSEELFVTFANTLSYTRGQPIEGLPDVDALLSWLREQGLISDRARASEGSHLHRDPAEAERRMERFRMLRTLLHETAEEMTSKGQPTPEQLRALNHILRHGLHYHQLRLDSDGTRYTLAQVGDRLDQARATIAGSFAQLLADDASDRLRVCANEGCRWIFVDHSPTGRRRWCDMRTCGNQAKVARHRARAKAHAVPPVHGVPPVQASV
jgi:predicted RNA-binding Zn ribbon-like protein